MKKSDYKVALPIVKLINKVYSELNFLSNDELRKRCRDLRRKIAASKENNIPDEYLIECFAIVKDTARRFCQGNIKVTANAFDKKLAQQFEFVNIEGKYAIYKNEWKAGGCDFRWEMIHYDTQLLSGIFLHKGYAVEMATGEGKTLAVTLPAFLNSLRHKGVHIQTVNDYLSKRDCELTRPIYMFHGISVDCLEYYIGNLAKTKVAYASDICFGSNETFVFDYLRNNNVKDEKELIQIPYNYCIIDELDSILIDRACTPYILQGDRQKDALREGLLPLKDIVEELVLKENLDQLVYIDRVKKNLSISKEACDWFEEKLDYKNLFKTTEEGCNSEDENVSKDAYKRNQLLWAIFVMLYAYCLHIKDVDYIVDRDKIIVINPNTGRLDYNVRWENGLHQAVEIKEGVECKDEYKPTGTITLGNFLKLYSKQCGMSGTISNVANELGETYDLQSVQIPTNLPSIRKDNPLHIYSNTEEKYNALVEVVRLNHKNHRPILISCISTLDSDNVAKILKEKGFKVRTLNAKNLEKEAYIISHAGELDAITVSTAIAGRGTDIKISEEAKAVGGLLVISTCMFESSRIDDQLRGRAGRQGDPGESIFLVSLEDLILHNLPSKEREKIASGSCILSPNKYKQARKAFIKAQITREDDLRKTRHLFSTLDNSMTVCREIFYRERLSVLKNPLSVYEHLKEQANRFNVISEYEDHLGSLYLQVRRIFENAINNNLDGEAAVIFSEKQELFSISFNIEKLLNSQNYFVARFVQQLTLFVLDLFWSHFINIHRMSYGISPKELLKSYKSVKQQCDEMVLHKVFRCCIPVNFIKTKERETFSEDAIKAVSINKAQKAMTLTADSTCPCGSGELYFNCHGKRLIK